MNIYLLEQVVTPYDCWKAFIIAAPTPKGARKIADDFDQERSWIGDYATCKLLGVAKPRTKAGFLRKEWSA